MIIKKMTLGHAHMGKRRKVKKAGVPSVEQMLQRFRTNVAHLPIAPIWINLDCGMKTRCWEEVIPVLKNMVTAAQQVREESHAQ